MVMQSTKGAMLSSAMVWRSEMNDVIKRLGDLRINPSTQGAWVRISHGKMSSDKDRASYKENYTTTQVGYDIKNSKDRHLSIAGSYSKGSGSYSTGSGNSKLSAFALYGTYMGQSGEYIDLIAKVGRLKNDFDVTNDAGNVTAHGDYQTYGRSVSAEYGRRIQKDNNYYIEPQIEFIFGRLDGVDHDMRSNGYGTLHVRQSALNSAIGRVGFALGNSKKENAWFMKASLYHEFSGDMDTTWHVTGEEEKYTTMGGKDTWLSLQLGGTFKMSDQATIYGTFEKTFGSDIKTDHLISAGVRYSF